MGAVQADELFDVLGDAHERRASLSAVSGQGRRDLHLADVVVEGLVDRLTTLVAVSRRRRRSGGLAAACEEPVEMIGRR